MRLLFVALLLATLNLAAQAPSPRERLSLDLHWRFALGHPSDVSKDFNFGTVAWADKTGDGPGVLGAGFNDRNWKEVNLPHDWAVEQDFAQVNNGDVEGHGYKKVGALFPENSIGWYRKAFFLSKQDAGKAYWLQFDGVFRNCQVWINGFYLGANESGYMGFGYDVSDYLLVGRRNVIVVRVDARQYEGWFYEGAGIYRHVWLEKSSPVRVARNGVFVHSKVENNKGLMTAEISLENTTDEPHTVAVTCTLRDNKGEMVNTVPMPATTIRAHKTITVYQDFSVIYPKLWSPETPNLYNLEIKMLESGKALDAVTVRHGIRSIVVDKDNGLIINGKNVKIKGVCCHQDHAGVGVAVPDDVNRYRIRRLKEMGCNAYRSSHNPPTPELLDACDELGMLVLDETRSFSNTPEAMSQFERLLLRDRNHPSVFMWSIGNEEWFVQDKESGKAIARDMIRLQQEIDPTRLSTFGANNGGTLTGVNEVIPVRGFNYNMGGVEQYRKARPDQPLLGTEEASTVCTRGVYARNDSIGYLPDYDLVKPDWGHTAEEWWQFYGTQPWLMGGFVWTGFDYRGEPTPMHWPNINSHFGIMDMCGFAKNNFYYYQAWWSGEKVLHLFPHWNWTGQEGRPINVWVQSNADSVELSLNGRIIGRKAVPRLGHVSWVVPYQAGTLEAKGWFGDQTQTTSVHTASKPATLKITPDRTLLLADNRAAVVCNVSVEDAAGNPVATAADLVQFSIEGPGRFIGVGNGDPSSHEPDHCIDGNWQRKLFNGYAQVIVQSTDKGGNIVVKAEAAGLKAATVSLNAVTTVQPPAVADDNPDVDRHLAFGGKVTYGTAYGERFSAGGDGGLVDGVSGTGDYQDGSWQGWEQTNAVYTVDLGKIQTISTLKTNWLRDIYTWIFLPEWVEYAWSEDGVNFQTSKHIAFLEAGPSIQPAEWKMPPVKARFVRVTAKNRGVCPPGHPGAGRGAWIFTDEITVK